MDHQEPVEEPEEQRAPGVPSPGTHDKRFGVRGQGLRSSVHQASLLQVHTIGALGLEVRVYGAATPGIPSQVGV